MNVTQIIGDIARAAATADAEPARTVELSMFAHQRRGAIEALGVAILDAAATWIEEQAKTADLQVVRHAAAVEALRVSALIVAGMKQAAGEELSPARFSILAYVSADRVLAATRVKEEDHVDRIRE
jgi:hypothetical protein